MPRFFTQLDEHHKTSILITGIETPRAQHGIRLSQEPLNFMRAHPTESRMLYVAATTQECLDKIQQDLPNYTFDTGGQISINLEIKLISSSDHPELINRSLNSNRIGTRVCIDRFIDQIRGDLHRIEETTATPRP